jgi:hypothetical protein
MAYDKHYYEEKRIKLTNQIVKKMEDTITDITNTLNFFYQDKDALVADLKETVKLQEENSKEEKPVEEKKEVEEVVKTKKTK